MRSSAWNIAGGVVPLAVGLLTIPMLISAIGVERFGVLGLAWVVIGYFGVFDMGLGRALTRMVAEKLATNEEDEIPGIFWTAEIMMLGVGLLAAVATFLATPWLVERGLHLSADLVDETRDAFFLLAVSIPIITTATGLRGFLEAQQLFGLVNVVRIPLGIMTFVGPLAATLFSVEMVYPVAALIAARLLAWCAFLIMCVRVQPRLLRRLQIQRSKIKPLITFGGWMTISNTVGPIMMYFDRFLIGAVVSVTAVAYYVTPYEAITKLLVVATAMAGVLFPAFTSSFVRSKNRDLSSMFAAGVGALFLLLWVPSWLVTVFAFDLLQLWLGSEFALNSTTVLQCLAIGVLVNGMAHVPFYLIQAAGRPDLAAKTHLIELPLYFVALYFALQTTGLVGAAVVWSVRAAVDALVFFYFARRLSPELKSLVTRLLFVVALSAAFLAGALAPWPGLFRAIVVVPGLVVPFLLGWRYILLAEHRQAVFKALRRIPART